MFQKFENIESIQEQSTGEEKTVSRKPAQILENIERGMTRNQVKLVEGMMERIGDDFSKNEDIAKIEKCLNLMSQLIRDGHTRQQEQGLGKSILQKKFSLWRDRLEKNWSQTIKIWAMMICHGDKLQSRNALSLLEFLLDEKDPQAKEFLENLLDIYELDSKKILEAWRVSDSPESFKFTLKKNLEAIVALERSNPGIIASLEKEYGLRVIARYPIQLLEDQYKLRNNKEHPYGIALFPTHDKQGAFYKAYSVLEKLYGQLKELGYTIRIVECDSKIKIAKTLLRLNKNYGEGENAHKLSFAFIHGHGTADSIMFGREEEQRSYLHINDLIGRGTRRVKEFFEPNPTIILVSCSAGSKATEQGQGIGEKLSEIIEGRVIAPLIDTKGVADIAVRKDKDSHLNFDVRFIEDKQKVFSNET